MLKVHLSTFLQLANVSNVTIDMVFELHYAKTIVIFVVFWGYHKKNHCK